jgi:hypothetical protein
LITKQHNSKTPKSRFPNLLITTQNIKKSRNVEFITIEFQKFRFQNFKTTKLRTLKAPKLKLQKLKTIKTPKTQNYRNSKNLELHKF